jgi:hypothetical protein
MIRAVSALVVVAVACWMSGCTRAEVSQPDHEASASLRDAGPWEDDFREALASGVSDYEASILEDGRVTASELEDAHDHVRSCLTDSGLDINYFPDGGFELLARSGRYPDGFFERSDPVLGACEKRYDEYVTMLFEETRRNPEKQDDAKITVACLRRAGIVGKDYTERRWRSEYDEGVFSFDDSDPRARQCDLDPLGLWRDR